MSTCSYCWGPGHNKRGCPELKEDAAKDAKNGIRSWRTRYVEENKRKSKNRKCGYCKEVGHTRRTCTTLDSHKAVYVSLTKQLHEAYAGYFRRKGVAPGALVRSKGEFYCYKLETTVNPMCMVMNIRWHQLDAFNFRSNVIHFESTQTYLRSTYHDNGATIHGVGCLAEPSSVDWDNVAKTLRTLNGGYHYAKSRHEEVEVISPMSCGKGLETGLDGLGPPPDYKKMADNWYRERDIHCTVNLERQDLIDYWCSLVDSFE